MLDKHLHLARPVKFLILFAALATLLLGLLRAPIERGFIAALTLADLVDIEIPGPLDIRPPVERLPVRYRIDDRPHSADLYLSDGQSQTAMVLIHGAAAKGKDDPRLVGFATTLARARFAVLVPHISDLSQRKILARTTQNVKDAVDYLLARDDLTANPERVGIGAFSVAVGPALLTALDPRLGEHVQFVLAVGGYYDLPRTLTYLTTGYYRVNGFARVKPPNEFGKWVFARSNASGLENPVDRDVLSTLAQRKLDDRHAPVDDLVAQLSTPGRQVYAFITNPDPVRVRSLLARLPRPIRANINALDIASKDKSQLQARLILVHGRDDDVIPYHESEALAAAAPPSRADLFLLQGLYHVDTEPHLPDGWQFWQAIYTLLSEQGRG